MHEAKTKLSQLIRAMEAGEQVIIKRGGKPVAQLLPIKNAKKTKKRQLGQMKGMLAMATNFDDPLPDEWWSGHKDDPLRT